MQIHQIIGNIGNDAKIIETNGKKFLSFSVAVNSNYKDKDGNKVESTEWYGVNYQRTEGNLINFLKKGVKVFVSGKLSHNQFKNKEGQLVVGLNLHANYIELLSSVEKGEEKETPTQPSEDFLQNDEIN